MAFVTVADGCVVAVLIFESFWRVVTVVLDGCCDGASGAVDDCVCSVVVSVGVTAASVFGEDSDAVVVASWR